MPSDAPALAFGDIVLVPFPFTNQAASKKRPAVVISSQRYNMSKPDVVIMAVTSQLREDMRFGDMPVSHWQAAGLLKPSAIKPVIATLEQALVIDRLGSLEAEDIVSLRKSLDELLG